MKIQNAIKKLEKAGFKIKKPENISNRYNAYHQNEVIEFHDQDGLVICIKSRRISDVDDPQTDYSAGIFCDNISQAIRMTKRSN